MLVGGSIVSTVAMAFGACWTNLWRTFLLRRDMCRGISSGLVAGVVSAVGVSDMCRSVGVWSVDSSVMVSSVSGSDWCMALSAACVEPRVTRVWVAGRLEVEVVVYVLA